MTEPIITSLLDTDLYKLTMQAAIHKYYANVPCVFKLTNRTPDKKLTPEALDWLNEQIQSLGNLRFKKDELDFLRLKVGYLGEDYFKWLESFQLKPSEQIKLNVNGDAMELLVEGPWDVVTLYEIPVLALVSESYFRFIDTEWKLNGKIVKDNDSSMQLVVDHAKQKSSELLEAGCVFSEFGSRRRRSLSVHKAVMKGIMAAVNEGAGPGKCLGTSNVLLAKEFGTNPIGTIGHEWMMGVGAIAFSKSKNYTAYTNANKLSVEQYVGLVGLKNAGLALTDTYGTENFLQQFEEPYIGSYIGMRQDSGDPSDYVRKVSKWYKEKGYYNEKAKMVCFSDSLNVAKCIKLKAVCENECGMKASFGIGTNFTNDFDSEPMNIVCKLLSCGGAWAIKISDNAGKNMGDDATVQGVKKALGYVERQWAEGDETHRWRD
ncbi:nicotinate phosphoribosyltransferase [Martiniozyma asiatica (nom. inval.)]|nr:nicotinate phosphoribosyltransferase [Martiniozyma asiatica]